MQSAKEVIRMKIECVDVTLDFQMLVLRIFFLFDSKNISVSNSKLPYICAYQRSTRLMTMDDFFKNMCSLFAVHVHSRSNRRLTSNRLQKAFPGRPLPSTKKFLKLHWCIFCPTDELCLQEHSIGRHWKCTTNH